MKKISRLCIAMMCFLMLVGCSQNQKEPEVVNTYEQTSSKQEDNSTKSVLKTYYEMSDETWKTDDHDYKYRLELTGRLENAAKDTTYVVLSNSKDITFEQAWKASGLSSDTGDYFDEKDAVIVEME